MITLTRNQARAVIRAVVQRLTRNPSSYAFNMTGVPIARGKKRGPHQQYACLLGWSGYYADLKFGTHFAEHGIEAVAERVFMRSDALDFYSLMDEASGYQEMRRTGTPVPRDLIWLDNPKIARAALQKIERAMAQEPVS